MHLIRVCFLKDINYSNYVYLFVKKFDMAIRLFSFFLIFLGSINIQASEIINNNFFEKCDVFFKNYVFNGQVNYDALKENPTELFDLVKVVHNAELENLDTAGQKAFYINAYNLNVIKSVVLNYPINSVMDVSGFFDNEKHWIANKQMTLNDLENKLIRPTFNDARLHFVLVCGAVGCPPIINNAYTPQNVEELLERQTKRAINDPNFIRRESKEIKLSKIFEWYAEDFGKGKEALVIFLNKYSEKNKIKGTPKFSYYPYDWQLNKVTTPNTETELKKESTDFTDRAITPAPTDERYFVSALYTRGQYELNIFNNYFTSKSKNLLDGGRKFVGRTTFFTAFVSGLFGINNRFNVGFDAKVRSVAQNNSTTDRPAEFLNFANNDINESGNYNRFQLTAIGPRIKYTPIKNFGSFSVQQTLYIPTGKNLEGGNGKGFADWQGLTLWNQFFYDNPINDKFSLFVEFDVLLENFTSAFAENHYWQFSTPMTIIPSYFPNNKITIYALMGSAPQWAFSKSAGSDSVKSYAPYNQYGLGFKYQFNKRFLGELLYTEFVNSSFNTARTFNIGLRYIHR